MGLDEIRACAMALPEVTEGPPVPSARRTAAFKVAGKSFLGLEKGSRSVTVSLGEDEARAVVTDDPDAYEEIWRNGERFIGLRADLSKLSEERVRQLIERSWRHTAPQRVVNAYDNGR